MNELVNGDQIRNHTIRNELARGLGINFRIFCRNEFKIFVQMMGIKVKLHYALKSTLNSLPGEEYGPR